MVCGRRLAFAVAFVAIVAAFSTPDDASEDLGSLVMLSETETAPKAFGGPTYAEIPGFKFNYNTHPAKVASREECEQMCNSQKTCQSYSFAKKTNVCEWSTSKMQYDPDFVFNFKPANGIKYHEFPGLVYRATGWLKAEGKTKAECGGLCDKAAACAAFSYRERDQLCLLSGHSIGFHEDFNYYEKEGANQEFALRPNDKAKLPPSGKHPAQQASEEATVVSAAVHAAQQVVSAAESAAPAAAPIINGESPAVVAERLQAVKDWAAQKIKQEEENTQLKIKSNEVDNKAQVEEEKTKEEAKMTNDQIADSKAQAERKAERDADAARTKAAEMVKEVRLEAKEASVQAELSQAAAEKRDATVTVEKANKQLENVKEVDEKKAEQAKKELNEKAASKTNEDMQLKMIREKDVKNNHVAIQTAVAEKVAEVRKEMAQKSKTALEDSAERAEKTTDQEMARKSVRAVEMKNKKEELEGALDKTKESTEKLQAAEAEKADAVSKEQATKAQFGLEKAKDEGIAHAEVKANKIQADADAQKAISAAEQAEERSNELLRKKSNVEVDMESASKEAVNKNTDETCDKELKVMRNNAVSAEETTANQASAMPAAEGEALLDRVKGEWKAKIDEKSAECVPKEIKYTVNVRPVQSASVAAPSGPPVTEEELVTVELLEENEEPTLDAPDRAPDPWPLDHPVKPNTPDGTPLPSEPYPEGSLGETARTAAQDAARERGFQPIEAGAHQQLAYFKFKVAELRSGETVEECKLSLHKEGGPESACEVKLTSCDYDPAELTYATRPAELNMVSAGGTFPNADGPVVLPLDTQLITNYLANEAGPERMVCVEIGGGLANNPVMIGDVSLELKVHKDPGVVDTTARRRRSIAEVTMPRRRRTAIEDARRRRSVQNVKNKAKAFYDTNKALLEPQCAEEKDSKVPEALARRQQVVEQEVRAREAKTVEAAIQRQTNQEYKPEEVEKTMTENNEAAVEDALAETFPQKYSEDKATLTTKMRSDLTLKMTKEEEKVIEAEATTVADDRLKDEKDVLLEQAITAKTNSDFPKALMAEVEKNAPADYTQAIEEVVVAQVQQQTNSRVDAEVQKAYNAMLNVQEPGVATAASTKAIGDEMTARATQAIEDKKQAEITANSALGQNLQQAPTSNAYKGAMGEVEAFVAANPVTMTTAEETAVAKPAVDTAVAKLEGDLLAQAESETKTPNNIKKVVADLKQEIMDGPVPAQVKADILKNIQDDIVAKGDLKKQVTAKVRTAVMDQQQAVLAKLHLGLIQEEKAKLVPQMNAKLSVDIPTAMNSAKFLAEVEAAQLEMKEQLKEDMKKELMEPMERVSKAKMKADMEVIKNRIKVEVKAQKELEANSAVATATTVTKLKPEVDRELEVQTNIDCEKQIKKKTKDQVNRELGPMLRQVVEAKYEEGTMNEAKAFVKQNREAVIRQMVKNKIALKVHTAVQAKLPGAKIALQTQVVERLQKELFTELKANKAEELKEQTQGMSNADAAAVELQSDNALRVQAKTDAEKNALVEMANHLTQQLKDRLTQEETTALSSTIETKVNEQVEKEATAISTKSLDKKYEDDLEAMQQGFNHVSQMAGNGDEEHNGPDVVDAAGIVGTMANGAAALMNGKILNANATQEGMAPEEIPTVDFDALVNKTADNAVTDNAVNTTPVNDTVVTPVNDTDTDVDDVNGTDVNGTNETEGASFESDLVSMLTSLF